VVEVEGVNPLHHMGCKYLILLNNIRLIKLLMGQCNGAGFVNKPPFNY